MRAPVYWTAPDGRSLAIMAGGDEGADDAGLGDALDEFANDPANHAKAEPAAKAEPTAKAEPAAKAEPTAKADKGPAPWEKDLADRGLNDPAYLEYHRDVVQPYITQREQALAAYTKIFGDGDEGMQHATIGANVLNALDDDPIGTLVDIIQDLEIPPAQIAKALGLDGGVPAAMDADDQADGEDAPEPDDPDRAFVAQLRQEREEQAAQAKYDELIDALKEEVGESFDEAKFHVAMRATGGDAREAWDIYSELMGDAAVPPDEDPPVEDAPPVMGAGVGTTPVASTKEPRTLDEAFDQFFAEDRASRVRA